MHAGFAFAQGVQCAQQCAPLFYGLGDDACILEHSHTILPETSLCLLFGAPIYLADAQRYASTVITMTPRRGTFLTLALQKDCAELAMLKAMSCCGSGRIEPAPKG